MTSPPEVSIGVPVYNGARFLDSALDSLLGQSLSDFELIISDNASTDETAAICAEYAARDARIRYFRQERNIGAPHNWNFVARQATGRYFKWASANDVCAPTLLARCVAALEADPQAVLAQGTTCLVNENDGRRQRYRKDLALDASDPVERLHTLYTRLRLNNGQCGVIRLDCLRRTGLDRPYPGGDLVLMAELAMQGRFLVLPEVLLYRRMGPDTFTRDMKESAMRQFYNPNERTILGDRVRLHVDLLLSAGRAPLSLRHRLGALRLGLRVAAWNWPRLSLTRKQAKPVR